ncbi:MAG: hypothetical protein K6F33_14010 [Bacteroidales bacterium]|nr:hypothetical protein [Bacteroidales bacterium]
MKKSILIIPVIALMASCGGGQQTQNSGTAADTTAATTQTSNNAAATTPTETSVAEVEYTGKGALPELVFDNLEFHQFEYLKDAKVPDVVKNAKRIVFKGDQIKIFDGTTETVCKIDLESSSEEANPDGYYWMFPLKDNQPVENAFHIVAEYEEASTARNEDPKKRPIHLILDGNGLLYPKNFNSWDNLKRKITSDYPSDEKYNEVLQYINREEPDLSDMEEEEHVAMDVWDILLKEYDPLGMLEGDEKPSEDMIAQNRKYVKEKSFCIAVFDSGSDTEGFIETVSCYWHNDNYWIVLDYWQSTDSPNSNLKVFKYQNNELTRLDNYFPADFLGGGKYIGTFNYDEISVVRDTDEAEEVQWYSWNSEEFVKQE